MKQTPRYGEAMPVGVHYRGDWTWYVIDKEYWVLDYNEWARAGGWVRHVESEYSFSEEDFRRGIAILDTDTVEVFLKKIATYQVNKKELCALWSQAKKAGNTEDIAPMAVVDFDNKRLWSTYIEGVSFEDFVPEGWDGEFVFDLTEYVPEQQQYWK